MISNDVVDENNVEITTNDRNDIFIDTFALNKPDPAIVDSKIKKNPIVTGWPDLEDGRIRTNLDLQNGRKAALKASAQ